MEQDSNGCFTHLEDVLVLQDHSGARFGLIVTRIDQISALEQEFSHFSKLFFPFVIVAFLKKLARLKNPDSFFVNIFFANSVQENFQDKFNPLLMPN